MGLCAGLGAWLRFSPFAPLPLKRFRLKFSELGDVCKCFKRLRPGLQWEGHLWVWPRSVPPPPQPAELRVLGGAAFWVGLLVHLVETEALPSPEGGRGLLSGEVGSGLLERAVLRGVQAASGSAGGSGLQPPHCVQCWGLVAAAPSWAPPASRPGSEDRPCLLWVILVGNPTNQEGF